MLAVSPYILSSPPISTVKFSSRPLPQPHSFLSEQTGSGLLLRPRHCATEGGYNGATEHLRPHNSWSSGEGIEQLAPEGCVVGRARGNPPGLKWLD